MNLFLILLLLNALFGKRDRLYCGLFGWVGTSVDHFVPLKLKLLGLLNDSRGGDGVGLFNGSALIKSVIPDEFGKLIITDDISRNFIPTEIPVFLGHTRKRSTGVKDMEHTQPIVETTENGLESRIFHNGTIHDLTELIATATLSKEIPTIFGLSDTQVLAKMLHILREEEISFKVVLENYSGSASLMMSFSDDPGSVYIFRGRMRYSTGSWAAERPLYYVREQGRGYYISSMEESLKYISDNEQFEEVKEVPENTLIRLSGDTEAVVEVIEREFKIKTYPKNNIYRTAYDDDCDHDMGCGYNVINHNKPFKDSTPSFPRFSDLTDMKSLEALVESKNKNIVSALDYISGIYSSDSIANRYFSKPDHSNVGRGKVMFYKGRYIIAYRTEMGYSTYSHLANMSLILDEEGCVCYPTQRGAKTYHFYQGILLKPGLSVTEITSASKCTIANSFLLPTSYLESLEYFMKYVEGPISIFNRISGTLYELDYNNSLVKYSGKYQPLFCNKIFTLDDGLVTSMTFESTTKKLENPALEDVPFEVTKDSRKRVYYTRTELAVEKFKCPSCNSKSLICLTCKGNGYVTEEVLEKYIATSPTHVPQFEPKSKVIKLSESTSIMLPAVYNKEQERQGEVEDMVNREVIEKIHSLSNMIVDISGEINIIGESSPLLEKYKILLENIQDDLISLVYV